MIAFAIWLFIGCLFVLIGIYCFLSKKNTAFGFWANAETFPVNDIKAYNRAVGKLWCCFGTVFVLLGLPLLKGQDTAAIIFSVLGLMAEVIITMAVYVTIIEPKYRKKHE